MKKLIILVVALGICILFIGCDKKSVSKISNEKTVLKGSNTVSVKVQNTKDFIKSLENSGFKPKTTKQVNEGLISGDLTIVNINEDTIGVYEYKNNEEMEKGAKPISSNGSMIGGAIYEWISKVHFYKNGNIIVLYMGINIETIKEIEKLLGKQFAGDL